MHPAACCSASGASGVQLGTVFAFCEEFPNAPDLEFGNLSISVDVPAQVEAGEPFDIVVTGMGVQIGSFGPAPTNAVQGTISVSDPVSGGLLTMGDIPVEPPIVLPWYGR